MTSKPISRGPAVAPVEQFPDFPPRDDMQNPIYLYRPGHLAALDRHFGAPETTIVLGEVPVGWSTSQREGVRIPDLLIAFNVDRAGIITQRGYGITAQGKPPDFALEIASSSTGRNDYVEKRAAYAAFGVTEYWRFDPTGGQYHEVRLAGDRLVSGEYQSIEIVAEDGERYWGHSEALGLDLCWEAGQLRWYDPVAGSYLLTADEESEGRLAAETALQSAEAEREREATARQAAERRILELEAELEAELRRRQT